MAVVSPLAATFLDQFGRHAFINAPSNIAPPLKLTRRWRGSVCESQITNHGTQPARIKEVVLFDLQLPLPTSTRLYGEGFQMLSQTGGTLGAPADLGNYTDAKHYKMPAPQGAKAMYGMMTLSPSASDHHLLAFISCRRFAGQFYLSGQSLKVVVDTEDRELRPGETWQLESFMYESGNDRERLLENLAARLVASHPRLRFPNPPTGWCSWYCFGPRVTAQQVLDNLDFIAKNIPGLR